MSFCCGASMIGTRGIVKHLHTRMLNVPTLYCPVCHRTDVHYLVRREFEILAEYVAVDGASEINFLDYVQGNKSDELFENCINQENDDPMDLVDRQIDMSLDLLRVAKEFGDNEWEGQLKSRLAALSIQREIISERRITG
ncbi:hypothetical protein [Gorillibacterium timonense]|uniref:hypothetical protein n=1 Tax=Gorillibacterium timonense TaxID=1689269 RepID=UPI00071D9E16|nr:hypothetical protein [Gorillibacterium timonense]